MPAYVDKTKGTANYFQVFFVGISMVMAGHCAYWPGGLFQGFWEFFISTMIISLAFLCLCLCLSEMISILPFGGGAYGFSRVTMGPYIGFMVGFFDSISNIIYVALFNRAFVILFNFCFHIDYRYDDQPLMWFIVYVGIVVLQVLLGKFSFNFFTLMGIIVLAIPVVFVLGTTHLQNFHENVVVPQRLVKHELFPLGSKGFLRLLPISGLLYFGIDMLCLIAEDTKNAAVVVPRVMMVVYFVTFALAIALIFSVASQYPGILGAPYNPLPMTFGFMDMFKTGFMKASITVLPSEIMEVYALTYAFGRQMCALSRSSLLPPMFSWTTSHNVPYMSLILGSVVGMLGLVVLLYADEKEFILRINLMYYVAQLCSITVYVVSMLSYLVFRFKYSVLERHFDVGWLGVPMAVLGIAIFAILFIMLSFFELDGYFLIKSYTILFAFGTVYYFGYARAHQSFSQEEQSILFAVYVIKANSRHRTVYRWLEKKYQRYVLKNVASASSKLRSSLRKSASKTKSKVTPAENTVDGNRLPVNSSESKLPGSEALVSIASDELYRSSLVSVTDGAGTGYEMLPQQSKESGMLVQLAPVTQLETAVYTDPNAVQKQESEDDLDQMMRDQIKYKQHPSTKSETVSRRVMQTEFGDENVAATQSRRNSYSMTSP